MEKSQKKIKNSCVENPPELEADIPREKKAGSDENLRLEFSACAKWKCRITSLKLHNISKIRRLSSLESQFFEEVSRLGFLGEKSALQNINCQVLVSFYIA